MLEKHKILITLAKKDMHKLIVRVWDFSTCFNDLPKDYQDVLIKRALENEGKNH